MTLPFEEQVLKAAQEDARILAVWTWDVPTPLPVVTLILPEAALADFYAHRQAWVARWFPGHTGWPIQVWEHALAVFARGELQGVVEWLGWGQVPEYPFSRVRVLFDRTGRLATRLHFRSAPHRVEYANLTHHFMQFWLYWSLARQTEGEEAVCVFYAARAYDALVRFLHVADFTSGLPDSLGRFLLLEVAGLEEALPLGRDCRAWLAGLARTMQREGARISRTTGWPMPELGGAEAP